MKTLEELRKERGTEICDYAITLEEAYGEALKERLNKIAFIKIQEQNLRLKDDELQALKEEKNAQWNQIQKYSKRLGELEQSRKDLVEELKFHRYLTEALPSALVQSYKDDYLKTLTNKEDGV